MTNIRITSLKKDVDAHEAWPTLGQLQEEQSVSFFDFITGLLSVGVMLGLSPAERDTLIQGNFLPGGPLSGFGCEVIDFETKQTIGFVQVDIVR